MSGWCSARADLLLLVAVVGGVSLPRLASAQLPDLVDLSAGYTPGAALEDPRPAEVQVTSYDLSLNVPVPLAERTYLIPGLNYHVESVSFARTPPGFTDLRAFHALELAMLLVQLLPSDFALSLRVAPGLAGDFRAVDRGLVRLSAMVLLTRVFSDRFVLGGGGLVSYAFGSLLPLPAVYFDWQPLDGFRVEGFLPALFHAKVSLFDRVEVGLRADVSGNAYAIRDARITEAWPCSGAAVDAPETSEDETVAVPNQCFDHVAYSVVTGGGTVAVRVFESVWLNLFVGHTLFRRFEQMNRDDVRIAGGVQDLPGGVFIRSGLTWRIPRDG